MSQIKTVPNDERGISLAEVLVSLVILAAIMVAFGGFLIQSTKINKSRQMQIEAQSTARNSLSLILNAMRSAGWDPPCCRRTCGGCA